MSNPIEGELRGIGLRPDPQEILIAPHDADGVMMGYTIIDKAQVPAMYIEGEWKDVVPEGVWVQMLNNWDSIGKTAKEVFQEYPEYLEYPEIVELIG